MITKDGKTVVDRSAEVLHGSIKGPFLDLLISTYTNKKNTYTFFCKKNFEPSWVEALYI